MSDVPAIWRTDWRDIIPVEYRQPDYADLLSYLDPKSLKIKAKLIHAKDS